MYRLSTLRCKPTCTSINTHLVRNFAKKSAKREEGKSTFTLHPDYEVWVGLETHAQVLSNTKLFSDAKVSFHSPPNTNAALFDASIPGTLPRINEECINQALKLGLALGGRVNKVSNFDRKHYFYCDMPLGYQITQQTHPIIEGGEVNLDSLLNVSSKSNTSTPSRSRTITIQRIQLEQDSGKSLHDIEPYKTHIDLNRAGTCLLEIVTDPNIESAEEAIAYLKKLQNLLRHLHVSTGNFEDGSMRCDVNVTVRRKNGGEMTQRVEIKNMNSFKFIQRAIEYEAMRQIELCEQGIPVLRETRRYDPKTGTTFTLRKKEDLLDYRFLPEPDLPPLTVTDDKITQIQNELPVLPDELYTILTQTYKLDSKSANILLNEPGATLFFLDMMNTDVFTNAKDTTTPSTSRTGAHCYNWLTNELFGQLRKNRMLEEEAAGTHMADVVGIGEDNRQIQLLKTTTVTPAQLATIVELVTSQVITGKNGKELVVELIQNPTMDVVEYAKSKKMMIVKDVKIIEEYIDTILSVYTDETDAYVYNNRTNMLPFLCGQTIKYGAQMKEAGTADGDACPALINKLMKQKLDALKAQAVKEQE